MVLYIVLYTKYDETDFFNKMGFIAYYGSYDTWVIVQGSYDTWAIVQGSYYTPFSFYMFVYFCVGTFFGTIFAPMFNFWVCLHPTSSSM
jgi:hypothetical protein